MRKLFVYGWLALAVPVLPLAVALVLMGGPWGWFIGLGLFVAYFRLAPLHKRGPQKAIPGPNAR